MINKERENIDCSSLSLPEIIEKKTKRKASFYELNPVEQRSVLNYIEDSNIDLKIFKRKWYDVLSNKFYAVEYQPSGLFFVTDSKNEFDNFDDFYEYVRGDIYENSCYYGYIFSDKDINKYHIDLKSLNFDSLINETTDSYSFDSINLEETANDDCNKNRAKQILLWIEKCEPISTYTVLESKLKQFTSTFNFWDAKYVFLSMILRKDKKIIKNAAVRFAYKHDIRDGLSFGDILLTYGKDDALRVINCFACKCSYSTKKKRISNFKDALENFESQRPTPLRMLGFDHDLQLYYVKDRYYSDMSYSFDCRNYFGSFDEFILFVNGDLSGADLSRAPISREEINKYKINEKTKYPLPEKFEKYEIEKKYANENFCVTQEWFGCDGTLIFTKQHSFEIFFDFVHFLKGDLSNANLLLCDGIERIASLPGLKIDGIKVRSQVAEKLGLKIDLISENRFKVKDFEVTNKNEIETIQNFLDERPEDDEREYEISYMSDIHLCHKFDLFKCRTVEDIDCVIKTMAKTIGEQSSIINLIGGDTAGDFETFKCLVNYLNTYSKGGYFFFVLGNHELWGLSGDNYETIVTKYRQVLEENGSGRMRLVQNNLFYLDDDWKEISEKELITISPNELRERVRGANVIVFGGVGFAGMSEELNANNGIYMDVINREEEKANSTRFVRLYTKVTDALKDKNLIVLTHMPMKDWGGEDIHAKEGVVYVNGHTHFNYFYDDGKKRIYADNQIGYKGKKISLKYFTMSLTYDWFADYKDGIYKITKKDYLKFYHGVGETFSFNRQYEKLFMIKRDATYMFLMQSSKGSLLILNGGSIRKTEHSLEYFYENLVQYSKSVRMFLSKYDAFQKQVSSDIKKIGGNGRMHGSIVDIDYFHHLYLNPLDGSVTPYFASSIVDKYVYANIPSLLKYGCPNLYVNYEKLITQQQHNGTSLVIFSNNFALSKDRIYVGDTEMYRISRILKGLQFTTRYNIVRLWNDAIATNASEENGRLIVSSLINPDSISQTVVETSLDCGDKK